MTDVETGSRNGRRAAIVAPGPVGRQKERANRSACAALRAGGIAKPGATASDDDNSAGDPREAGESDASETGERSKRNGKKTTNPKGIRR